MTDKLNFDFDNQEAAPGVICKLASVSPLEVGDSDLRKINKYTLSPISTDDVFVFKATIADNESDDRNGMPFNLKALQDLKKLYPGRTMLKDHSRRADNQVARVFDTELIQDANKLTDFGEIHTELIAKMYMVRTESNKDLIAEIIGGIKKEVSTSTVPKKMICNICGTDNMKEYCRHYPRRVYDVVDSETGKSIKKRCMMILHGAKEAYELSFVAVPAQPRAGAHKNEEFVKPVGETAESLESKNEKGTDKLDSRLLSLMIKNAESFFNTESEDI
ncbi:hypothetical protein AALA22_10695 [Anaerovoracaceae bacterium 41-7]|uniref:hypothetical protein n=1 Tax=Emergencia sp. JLR.KK010 TaxID=3114296 RepID=UPI0030CB509A